MQLAEQRAKAQLRVDMLMQINQPTDYKDQVKADAAYKLATDTLARCNQEYQEALNAMTTTDLINLTK